MSAAIITGWPEPEADHQKFQQVFPRDLPCEAGTFKAFQIDRSWRIKVSTGPSPNWSDTVWWAPDVKSVVKFESGARNAQNWELISYTLKP
jgi:hypothetical protein